MFFAIELLIPQHGGKFSVAWIAATRGIRYIDNKEILKFDIVKICDEILQMVQSSSSRPKLRLSLSLASRLINGVTKVYKRQLEITIEDLQAFFCQVRAPPTIDSSISVIEAPRRPVRPVQRKRKRNIVDLSQELVVPPAVSGDRLLRSIIIVDEEIFTRPSIVQPDPDVISIREELPIRHEEEMAADAFVIPENDDPPAFPVATPPVFAVPLPPGNVPSTPKKRKPTDTLGTPTKQRLITRKPEHEVAQPEIIVVPPQFEVQVVPATPTAIETEEVAPTQLEPEPAAPQVDMQISQEINPRGRRVRNRAIENINMRRTRVQINRCLPNVRERFVSFEERDDIELVDVTAIDITDLHIYRILEPLMEEHQTPEELLAELRTSLRNPDSLLRGSSGASFPHLPRGGVTSGTPVVTPVRTEPIITPVVPQNPQQSDIQPVQEEPVLPIQETAEPLIPMDTERLDIMEKGVQPLAESTGVSLPQMDIVTPSIPSRTIETVLPPAAQIERIQREVVVSTGSVENKTRLTRDRQKRIKNMVKYWNFEQQGDIKIEDVCQKPINRKNIAIAFNDLLCLHGRGYVKLNNKPDSLELDTIEKGPLLL